MSKDDKVVPIGENTIHIPGIQDTVVKLLSDLLEQSERGEIVGIVIGAVKANHSVGVFFAEGSAAYSSLIAAACMCEFDLCHVWDKNFE